MGIGMLSGHNNILTCKSYKKNFLQKTCGRFFFVCVSVCVYFMVFTRVKLANKYFKGIFHIEINFWYVLSRASNM